MKEVSNIVMLQRIRNRIIEYLGAVSSYEKQGEMGPTAIICRWEDWVVESWNEDYVDPVFSKEEQDAIGKYNATWEQVADLTPDPPPALEELVNTEAWKRLHDEAEKSLAVFHKRGKLSEEHEGI